ncbi:MAG: hypothetical protein IPF97_00070 [Sphingomonadales bacterium]|nr:hypothetical protein [Sphingomonadales bacterium]
MRSNVSLAGKVTLLSRMARTIAMTIASPLSVDAAASTAISNSGLCCKL